MKLDSITLMVFALGAGLTLLAVVIFLKRRALRRAMLIAGGVLMGLAALVFAWMLVLVQGM